MDPPNMLNTAVVEEWLLSETAAQTTGPFLSMAQNTSIWEKHRLSKFQSRWIDFCAIVERVCYPQMDTEIGKKRGKQFLM